MTTLYSWVCPECERLYATVEAVPAGQAGDRLRVRCPGYGCDHVVVIHDPVDGGHAAMRRGAQ